jgi:serine/threonine-protein kinase
MEPFKEGELLEIGQVIRGTYTVERFLGEGMFGEVYRVKHRHFGRQAMKVFKNVGTLDETERALEEAIILSSIAHRNIIRVYDADIMETAKGSLGYFTMEYVAGRSLEQFWQSYGNEFVPVETAVDILRQVCRGLAHAHGEDPPIIHRDIKPQNILVGYDAHGLRACLSDFGLAKRVNPLLLAATARGTRCFKAPETFLDPKSDSCAGDVWALGVTLYWLLTDRHPFSGGDLDALDFRDFERPMIPASRLNIQVDKRLDQILSHSLAVKRDERYPSAQEILQDLSDWKPVTGKIAGVSTRGGSSGGSKVIFDAPSPVDEKTGREMVSQAFELSRRGRLSEAADLLEESFNKWPALREDYENQVKLWRRGIIM